MWIILSNAEPVVVNHGVLFCANRFEILWGILSHSLSIIVYYTESLVLYHCQLCRDSGCESWWGMLIQWFVNHGVLCCSSGVESWRVMLSQWSWIIVSYAEPVVVKHCELCWAQGVGIMVRYAKPVVVNHCAMLNQVFGNYRVLFWASGCESRCECCASGCESLWVMLSQWLWINVC